MCFNLSRPLGSRKVLTLKAPITTAADDSLKYFVVFQRKPDLIFHVNPETSSLIFFKKVKTIRCHLLQILFGTLNASVTLNIDIAVTVEL